jgi:cell wall-associated NlpC family hydrolase
MLSRTAKIQRTLPTLIGTLVLLGACSGGPPIADSGKEFLPATASSAADYAVQQVGVPYRYGGSDTSGFDCSGLVHYSYARAGKSVPRTTDGLWRASDPVPTGDLRRGDVLFFRIEGKVSHVGIYLGGDRFVHAPSSGREVTVEKLDSPYYERSLVRAGRP